MRSKKIPGTTLPKSPTGITGFDEITGGGLPRGRPALVAGGAGCGETMLAMAHSNQVRESVLSDAGIDLRTCISAATSALAGTARVAQEAHARAAAGLRQEDHARKALPKTVAGRTVGNQVARSGTSVAANYRAALRAKSDADFINKFTIR